MSATPARINLKPYRLLYWPFLLPVALLIALFNKISPIPFKIYALRVNRIGQMAGNQEELCCQLDLGLLPREFRVFIHRDRPCNTVLLDMQKRILPIHNSFLPLFDVCHKLGGLGISSMDIERYLGQDWEQWVTKTPQHLSFTEEETREAKKQCRALDIDPDAPFVPVLSATSRIWRTSMSQRTRTAIATTTSTPTSRPWNTWPTNGRSSAWAAW